MFSIVLDDRIITVKIKYKNNKNTYFRIIDANTIVVNASRKQSTTTIKEYIVSNKHLFLNKMNKVKKVSRDKNIFVLFGIPYSIIRTNEVTKPNIVDDISELYLPDVSIDRELLLIKNISKTLMLHELELLKIKYLNNRYVDIKRIKFKTKYMTSRYGSCNTVKQNININLNLIHYDKKYLEYVFLHEITHLVIPNHSAKFYKLFSKLCPENASIKKQLKLEYNHR